MEVYWTAIAFKQSGWSGVLLKHAWNNLEPEQLLSQSLTYLSMNDIEF